MKVLAIDTATPACAVALTDGGRVVGESLQPANKNHSETLLRAVDRLLQSAGVLPEQIELIAVSSGPGSFTGLRVGISTAQGLAQGLDKPLVGISSLEVLAYQVMMHPGAICPMIDARKQQVYTALFEPGPNGRVNRVIAETVAGPAQWLSALPGPALFVGGGACCYREEILNARPGSRVLPEIFSVPRASSLALLAMESYRRDGPTAPEKVLPLYVRRPDAELSRPGRKSSVRPA